MFEREGSEDFENVLGHLAQKFDQLSQGFGVKSATIEIDFIQPLYYPRKSFRTFVRIESELKESSAFDLHLIDAEAMRDLGVNLVQRWGYWDRNRLIELWNGKSKQGGYIDRRCFSHFIVPIESRYVGILISLRQTPGEDAVFIKSCLNLF